jgi:hypothetical protein
MFMVENDMDYPTASLAQLPSSSDHLSRLQLTSHINEERFISMVTSMTVVRVQSPPCYWTQASSSWLEVSLVPYHKDLS